MAGRLHDRDVEVALARAQLRRLGYTASEVEGLTSQDLIMQTVAMEAQAEQAAEEAKVAAWFQRAAKDATAIRMQQLMEVPDG